MRYREVGDKARPDGEHACTNPACEDHRSHYNALCVQVMWRGCDRVLEFTGKTHSVGYPPLAEQGYGTPPLKAGPVWLYAGVRILRGEPEVHGYLVARRHTDRLVQADVLGQVRIHRTKRDAWRWEGRARPRWHEGGVMMICDAVEQGFKTPVAAAKWVAAQAQPHPEA
ncbi:hypothetical protein [Kitasatospora fiedleri]|uniref:hypothetical protein n=1 Tax=Kitasatospora fiedleri TaxID=2991545 RepID=UPI00249A29BF|nr:hypothetical protein [Kitasatospora fiedleri]